jgi:tRNA-Thr(GGU) m(6)t(6)A37 methyltransferase TsaA
MAPTATSISLHAIGTVHCPVPDAEISRRRRELVSTIEIHQEYADALRGIEAYSHLFVLFWMDRAEPDGTLLCHPRGDKNIEQTGVFAARGRNHPNPVGLAVVELLDVSGASLTVRRLDAYDGTPVIDVKPYDNYDVVPDPRVPEWFRRRAAASKSKPG